MVTFFTAKSNFFSTALRWFLPQCCPACRAPTLAEGIAFCVSCWGDLPRLAKEDAAAVALPDAIAAFDAAFWYEDPIAPIVQQLKYNDMPAFAPLLAGFMAARVAAETVDILIPVPMHSQRLWRRQFNQSVLLAQEMGQILECAVDVHSLKRRRRTKPQRGMNAHERKKNLRDAFTCAEAVRGKRVLLVDDVWTTGSTANACGKALKAAGAESVSVICACYVAPDRIRAVF